MLLQSNSTVLGKLQQKSETMKMLQKDQFYKWMQKKAMRYSDAPKSFVNSVSKLAAARAGINIYTLYIAFKPVRV